MTLCVLSIFGTRPEAIKMAPVVHALRACPNEIASLVCVTAQHRQMLDQVLELFHVAPDVDLNLMAPGQTLPALTARVITGVEDVLARLQPDLVLVQGDTTTVMAAALAAFYRRIPVGHVEAGLRTNDRYNPFPEEINRRIAGQLATLHFAPTARAADALRREGLSPETIHVTGNTVIDALHWVVAQPAPTEVESLLADLGCGTGRADARRLVLVTAHRRESFGAPFEQICLGLRELARRNRDVTLVYPVHLNPNVREPVQRLLAHEERIHLIEPLSYLPFAHLMKAAHLVLTDSGGVQEEAPSLGVPVLVLRRETERQEAVEAGTVKLIGPDAEAIVRESERLLHDEAAYAAMSSAVSPYGDGHSAERIAQIILTWARSRSA
jgi:UDP-N-acetylglucosamine 2-epimerase (non-hydrolysing)